MATVSYYSDLDTIRAAKFGSVSTDDVSEATLNAACLDAANEINAKLDRLYSVPFDYIKDGGTPPAIITTISDVITMWLAKRYTVGHSTRTQGPLKEMLDEARDQLDRIADGRVNIPGVSRSDTGNLSSTTLDEHPVFASIDELDMGQDTDQHDRLIDERG